MEEEQQPTATRRQRAERTLEQKLRRSPHSWRAPGWSAGSLGRPPAGVLYVKKINPGGFKRLRLGFCCSQPKARAILRDRKYNLNLFTYVQRYRDRAAHSVTVCGLEKLPAFGHVFNESKKRPV